MAEFDARAVGIRARRLRLESAREVGPWIRRASVGVNSAATLAAQPGLARIGGRLIASPVAR
ncbi:putative type 12 methyltransferase [Mycobacterium kansasii 662]|uniref:Putative type 12 methyltransferase n=2 Tax=Mycobacterium kansasii TaxID=1768 RepID=A0A1V3WTM6_MYCKA|nr:putative type 12 methyltransferase [Mycobacterium kansasii 824]EUA08289.1 putative type 12 methyltransferase [Mycobacterium kansasii 662]KEP44568.1 hypothetical protein MKSMC1_03230 [Mycobacterium kansasii]OOK69896.1 putative type 12 methyltransferase [Mycobacterium kansasii]